jgi:hypothetical protein
VEINGSFGSGARLPMMGRRVHYTGAIHGVLCEIEPETGTLLNRRVKVKWRKQNLVQIKYAANLVANSISSSNLYLNYS